MVQEKTIRIRTADIPTGWLNARCRNLISKYALLAFRQNGRVFDLRSESIICELSNHAKQTEVEELIELHEQLKAELRAIVSSPSLRTALTIMAEKYDYLENNVSQ